MIRNLLMPRKLKLLKILQSKVLICLVVLLSGGINFILNLQGCKIIFIYFT